MSVERILKALAVTDQGLSTQEKATARSNIGAQGALTAGSNITISGDTISATDTTYSAGPNIDIYNGVISTEKPRVTAGTNVSVTSSLDQQTRTITYTVSATDTTYGVFSTSDNGLVPKASGTGDTGKFLKGDGTWEAISTTVSATAPLAGTGTAGDPLVLHISNGLSLVTPSGGTTSLQVTYPVPAPASGDNGKFLKTDSLGNFSWDTPAGASTVKKIDYGESSASTVSTLLIDSDDADGYAVVKCDNANKGALVVGPYKGLLDSGINGGSGKGSDSRPLYVDGNGQFALCNSMPKRSHQAELYFHHAQDGDHYNVRNIKNGCINHVAVTGHLGDVCYLEIEAPTLDGTGEEYDYTVVFDCTNSSGTCNVDVEDCFAEIFPQPYLDTSTTPYTVRFRDTTYTLIDFSGSPMCSVEVLGYRFTVHKFG